MKQIYVFQDIQLKALWGGFIQCFYHKFPRLL